MSKQLTIDDFQKSLNSHVAAKGDEIRERYGPEISWRELICILNDRSLVRYPCEIVFDAGPLLPGEFAHPVCEGERPEDGFKIYVHPFFSLELGKISYLVLYQLVLVNYGEFASTDDAETFAAHALGLPKEVYYTSLCELADQLDCIG